MCLDSCTADLADLDSLSASLAYFVAVKTYQAEGVVSAIEMKPEADTTVPAKDNELRPLSHQAYQRVW